MKTEFTPGPWTIDTGCDVVCLDGTTLLTRESYGIALDESFANARLAAAAPDLYFALDDLMHEVSVFALAGTPGFIKILQVARAALVKATGESE